MAKKSIPAEQAEQDLIAHARILTNIEAHVIGIQKALRNLSVEEHRRLAKDIGLRLATIKEIDWTGE